MPKENITYTLDEIRAGIRQTARAFMELFDMVSPSEAAVAEIWAEAVLRFSESPIEVFEVNPAAVIPDNNSLMLFLDLTACGRNLRLGFSKSGKIMIEQGDEILKQTSETRDIQLADIILPYGSDDPSRLLFINKRGSVAITKEHGSVVVKSFPRKIPNISQG